jgi:hypothetical protein
MPEVDFRNAIIEATGDKSVWGLWQRSDGKYILEKRAEIQGKNSIIPLKIELKGSKVIITQKGIALFQGRRLIIKTTSEGKPKMLKSQ